jgi:hypothetical protein
MVTLISDGRPNPAGQDPRTVPSPPKRGNQVTIRRTIMVAAVLFCIAPTTVACGGRQDLTSGDRTFCDTAAKVAPAPARTSGVDLDKKLGDVANKDLQSLASGVRGKSKDEVKVTADAIVDKCKDLGYSPRPS